MLLMFYLAYLNGLMLLHTMLDVRDSEIGFKRIRLPYCVEFINCGIHLNFLGRHTNSCH